MSLEVYDVELSICQQESLTITMTFYIYGSVRCLALVLVSFYGKIFVFSSP